MIRSHCFQFTVWCDCFRDWYR